MKRFHVHVSVEDLNQSIRFYSTLFATAPALVKGDYAKWMLEDPRINFAISQRGGKPGINHLGLQTDSDEELETLHGQLQQADVARMPRRTLAAAMPCRTSTGSPTRPASPGRPSTRWAASRPSMGRPLATRPGRAAVHRRRRRSVSRSRPRPPAAVEPCCRPPRAAALEADWPRIQGLLSADGLPTSDLTATSAGTSSLQTVQAPSSRRCGRAPRRARTVAIGGRDSASRRSASDGRWS